MRGIRMGCAASAARIGPTSDGSPDAADLALALAHMRSAVELLADSRGTNPKLARGLEAELLPALRLLESGGRNEIERVNFSVVRQESRKDLVADEHDEEVEQWLRSELNAPTEPDDELVPEVVRRLSYRHGARASFSQRFDVAPGETDANSLWVLPVAAARCEAAGESLGDDVRLSEVAQATARASLETWDHDMVALHEQSGGHALLLIFEALLDYHGLYDHCRLPRPTVRRFLLHLEACYGDNAYHNAMHAADVTLTVHLFLTKFGLTRRLSHLETLAALLAAACHDFNHPGTNNAHEVRLGTRRAQVRATAPRRKPARRPQCGALSRVPPPPPPHSLGRLTHRRPRPLAALAARRARAHAAYSTRHLC